MCRSIKPLFNYEPAVTDEEVRSAALQYVRKISGFGKPSQVNQTAFNKAVEEITCITQKLLDNLETTAPKRNREAEIKKKKLQYSQRNLSNDKT